MISLDDLVGREVGDPPFADDPAVAEHGEVGGDLDHLGDPVGDVDDRDAAREQVGDLVEQPAGLLGAQCLGRLVQDEHPGLGSQGGRDLDQVRLARGELRDEHGVVEVEPEVREVPRQPARRVAPGGPEGVGDQQQHRVEDREGGRERGRLVDDRQAAFACLPESGPERTPRRRARPCRSPARPSPRRCRPASTCPRRSHRGSRAPCRARR
ncbi:MAG: hypothetical protein R2740_02905 [Nocardioides sp.]